MSPVTDFIPDQYDVPPSEAGSVFQIVALPVVVKQSSLADLANGASISFDFNIDYNPIFDMLVYADQALDVTLFARIAGETYRQIGGAISSVASTLAEILNGRRFVGEQVRVTVTNNSGSNATDVQIQIHSRSL